MLGSAEVVKAPPDGYTLLLASNPNAISASLYSKLTHDPVEDFAPISLLASEQAVLLVHPVGAGEEPARIHRLREVAGPAPRGLGEGLLAGSGRLQPDRASDAREEARHGRGDDAVGEGAEHARSTAASPSRPSRSSSRAWSAPAASARRWLSRWAA